jgi:hypothetical protein
MCPDPPARLDPTQDDATSNFYGKEQTTMRTHPINWSRIDLPADARINEGYGSLAQEIVAAAGSGEARRVVVDGMWGAQWNRWSAALEQAAAERGIRLRILSTLRALRSPDALIEHFSYWLTDNPTFGRVCERPVWDYFEPKAFDQLVREFLAAAPGVDLQVLMGPGALSDATRHADVKVYCDVPREIIVNRQNSENLGNFGFGEHVPGHGPQKVAMYVEWPLLERHKRNIWNSIDVYASDCDGLAWIKRNGLDRLIADVSQPVRHPHRRRRTSLRPSASGAATAFPLPSCSFRSPCGLCARQTAGRSKDPPPS